MTVKFLMTNMIRRKYITTKATIVFLLKSLTCFLLAKVPTRRPLLLDFSENMFSLTGLVTFQLSRERIHLLP